MTNGSSTLLTRDALLAEARENTGLNDFGDDRFLEGLDVLLETYRGEANLSERGTKRQHKRLRNLLMTRLRVQAAWNADPSLKEAEFNAPIYVVGLPRTGTSALFNLIASSELVRPLYFWEGRNPDPIPVPDGEEDPRLVGMRDMLDRARKNNPAFTAIHETRADGPEECVTLMELALEGPQQGIEVLMEPYRSWYVQRDQLPLYRYYRDLLATLHNQRPGDRWMLKCPAHLWAIDELFTIFPDATVIQTHRAPEVSVPSYCSMIEALMLNRQSVDREELGARVVEYLAGSINAALHARPAYEDRFIDVRYEDFVADAPDVATNLADRLGLPMDNAARQRIQAFAAARKKDRHGAHDYSLEMYGLTRDGVRDAFAGYIDTFGL